MKFFKKKSYDCIISIGQGCLTPEILRDTNLRLWAGPFDWTFEKNYGCAINVIKNKFQNYFRKEDLEFSHYDKTNNKDVYTNISTGFFHNHCFPPSSEQEFDSFYNVALSIYQRRINRIFRIAEKKGAKIGLLYIERAHDAEYTTEVSGTYEPVITEDIIARDEEEINKIYNTKCFEIFYIKHDNSLGMEEYITEGHICRINNTPTDKQLLWKGNYNLALRVVRKHIDLKFVPKVKNSYIYKSIESFVRKIRIIFL